MYFIQCSSFLIDVNFEELFDRWFSGQILSHDRIGNILHESNVFQTFLPTGVNTHTENCSPDNNAMAYSVKPNCRKVWSDCFLNASKGSIRKEWLKRAAYRSVESAAVDALAFLIFFSTLWRSSRLRFNCSLAKQEGLWSMVFSRFWTISV